MINITTQRMLIRNFTPDDWYGLQMLLIDKETSEYAYTDYPFPTGEKEVKDITAFFSKGDDFLSVDENPGKKVIGYLAINNEKPGVYNLGYCFLTNYQNKRYGTEACTAIINHVFNVFKAETFTTGTAVINVPSCKLLAKLGFKKIGENTASFRKDENGKPIEFTGSSYELTREVWKSLPYARDK